MRGMFFAITFVICRSANREAALTTKAEEYRAKAREWEHLAEQTRDSHIKEQFSKLRRSGARWPNAKTIAGGKAGVQTRRPGTEECSRRFLAAAVAPLRYVIKRGFFIKLPSLPTRGADRRANASTPEFPRSPPFSRLACLIFTR